MRSLRIAEWSPARTKMKYDDLPAKIDQRDAFAGERDQVECRRCVVQKSHALGGRRDRAKGQQREQNELMCTRPQWTTLLFGFRGGHHHRFDTVGFRCALGRRLPESETRHDCRAHFFETSFFEQAEHLSFQESSANSAGPEFRIIHDRLRELLRADDIGNRNAPPRSNHAKEFFDHLTLLERKIDDTVRNHDIDRGIG